ncbi:MAG: insulinase family protein [Nanoarchaeota archaeon]|nr:insulinase family protein [Nanoarchaeota archaeon]
MRRERLPNGSVIISHIKPKDHTARLVVASRLGSIHEKIPGLSHLLEHCILSANTEKHRSIKISEKIDFLGGTKNGKSGYKSIRLYGSAHHRSFNRFADIFTDLTLRPKFSESSFEKEKKIIFNELKGNIDNLTFHLNHLLLSGLFQMHPFKTSIDEKIKALRKITLKDIINENKTFFAPENIVLGIFGNYKETTYQNIKNRLANIDRKNSAASDVIHINKRPLRKKILEKRVGLKQVYIATGFKTSSLENIDIPSLFVISSLLTRGSSSRLFMELRQKRGLIYSISSANIVGREFGYFCIRTRTEKFKGKETLRIIRDELSNLKDKKIGESELVRAKNKIISHRKAIYDIPIEGSLKMIEDEIVFGNIFRERKFIGRIKKVTSGDIKKTANKYFKEPYISTAVIRPE